MPQFLSRPLSSYIVGGSTASRNEFPAYSLLYADGRDGYIYPICGASKISSKRFLTAQHCTIQSYTSELYLVPKAYRFSEIVLNDLIQATALVEHSAYNSNNGDADIAILTVAPSVSGTPTKVFGGNGLLSGSTATVVGLGQLNGSQNPPNTLRKVNLSIVSNSQCKQAWGNSITNNMLCAGGTSSGGIGACMGDSGGPLFVSIEGQRVQAGVVSWGHSDCAEPSIYDVYARTSALIAFIKQHAPGASIVYDYDSNSKVSIAPIMLLLND